ncbi:hypothetical protein [Cereibacter changlensis]|uniref:hypothetical protein n=1 Tax=Cereibacter changlensis TaxID=402884 RepID=UPI0040349632
MIRARSASAMPGPLVAHLGPPAAALGPQLQLDAAALGAGVERVLDQVAQRRDQQAGRRVRLRGEPVVAGLP